jgi:flagellar biosynthesis protein FliQ
MYRKINYQAKTQIQEIRLKSFQQKIKIIILIIWQVQFLVQALVSISNKNNK